jgi:hypothetical protein
MKYINSTPRENLIEQGEWYEVEPDVSKPEKKVYPKNGPTRVFRSAYAEPTQIKRELSLLYWEYFTRQDSLTDEEITEIKSLKQELEEYESTKNKYISQQEFNLYDEFTEEEIQEKLKEIHEENMLKNTIKNWNKNNTYCLPL